MKYFVQVEIDPSTGVEVEAQPAKLQEWIGKWQALNPIGMYFYLDRRAVAIIVDVSSEDVLFEALHATWVLTESYPDVSPIVSVEEFPAILRRTGLAP